MYLLKKGANPKFWSEEVRNKECFAYIRNNMLKIWAEHCDGKAITELQYTKYELYGITGDRVIYERDYFHRRMLLETASALGLIYPENGEYLDYLHNIIYAICDEFTWTLPAHQENLLTNTDNTFIDLFDCETGGLLAEIYALYGDRLDPLIRNRIKLEVKKRVVDPYIKGIATGIYCPWWRGTYTGNWVAVCTANIATCIFHLYPECYEEVKSDMERLIGNFLSGFSDNGFCDEGPGYWGYGFGFFVVFADLLYSFTGGEVDYFENPKVKKIATYLQKMYLTEDCTVSFSDASRSCAYNIGLLHYLKKKYPCDVKVYSPKLANIDGKIFTFRNFIWFDEDTYNNPADDKESIELYDEGYQWVIKRCENYSFAAKAGHNNEHHNHNDVGSFIFAKNGKQILTDQGRGLYTKEYGDPETKYASNEASSSWHSLPIFDGYFQREGREFESRNVSYSPGVFSMNIAGAYGLDSLKRAERTFTFDNEGIKINDSFDYEGKITERFTSLAKPANTGDGLITAEGLTLTYNPKICTLEITEKRNTNKETYYTIDFILNSGVRDFEINIK